MPSAPPRFCPVCRKALTSERYCPPCAKLKEKSYIRTGKAFYATKEWERIRTAQIVRSVFCEWILDNGAKCNANAEHIDHWRPLRLGGTNHKSNLRSLCKRHHGMKTSIECGRLRWTRVHPANIPPELRR